MNRLLTIATLSLAFAAAGSASASSARTNKVFKTPSQAAARSIGAAALDSKGAVSKFVTAAQLNVLSRKVINSKNIQFTFGSKFNLGDSKVKVDFFKMKNGWKGTTKVIDRGPRFNPTTL